MFNNRTSPVRTCRVRHQGGGGNEIQILQGFHGLTKRRVDKAEFSVLHFLVVFTWANERKGFRKLDRATAVDDRVQATHLWR